MPTLERDNNLIDIDPFTIFGLFNKKSKDENRIQILNAIAELFDIKSSVPTSFYSLPVLNPQNATFYYFIDEREDSDIDDLWNLFESALIYADEPTNEHKEKIAHHFDLAINKKGNGTSKITMGLYWISPNSFLNLDSRNEWYIYKSGQIPKEIVDKLPVVEQKISAFKYFVIVETLKTYLQSFQSDFKKLSYEAWKYSNRIDKKIDSTSSALADEDVDTIHYWIYAAGEQASKWDEFYKKGIMAIGWGQIGDLQNFDTKDAMKAKMKEVFDPTFTYRNAAHTTWQFANEMKIGDIIFVKKGRRLVVGRGVVTSDYKFDENRTDGYNNIRFVNWTHKGEWSYPGYANIKTLTDITPYTNSVEELNALFENESEDEVERKYPNYSKEGFLSEVFMSESDYNQLTKLLYRKKNVILQGAPGVGKTFVAKRLAYSLMGEKDIERIMMVQFHQSFSYEDFIMVLDQQVKVLN